MWYSGSRSRSQVFIFRSCMLFAYNLKSLFLALKPVLGRFARVPCSGSSEMSYCFYIIIGVSGLFVLFVPSENPSWLFGGHLTNRYLIWILNFFVLYLSPMDMKRNHTMTGGCGVACSPVACTVSFTVLISATATTMTTTTTTPVGV